MADIFHSSKYSIEHAKRRFAELDSEITTWFKSNPYARIVDISTDGTQEIHKLKLTKSMPASLSGIVFDTANSLRSSLDQAGYAVARAVGKSGNDAHFPFGGTLMDAQSAVKRRSKELPKEIFDVMIAFKPYKGGDNLLWALNELCNSHKHEIVVPMASHTGGIELTGTAAAGLRVRHPMTWDRAKNEMEILIAPKGAEFNFNFKFQQFITATDIEFMDGLPIDGVLNTLVSKIESILMAIEGESRRIGINQ